MAHPAPETTPPSARKGRILLADDDAMVAKACSAALTAAGFEVETAEDGLAAVQLLAAASFDVVLSDISMPEMDGIALLRAVRERDLDVPVVLMTGDPQLQSAVSAVELGALRYLVKPVAVRDLVAVIERAVHLARLARLKREALAAAGEHGFQIGDRAGLEAAFSRAIYTLRMAYQPIVHPATRTVYAHEALVRSAEPTLPHPGALFDAAERLGRLEDLGRAIRARVAGDISHLPPQAPLTFVNLHPRDLLDDGLYSASAPLSAFARRIVLEITERVSLGAVPDVAQRVQALRRLGYRIAVDDLGAGYAGLTTFAQLEPEVVKLDIALVRDVDSQPLKQRVVKSMTELCAGMGMRVIAEGVETPAESETLRGLGCDLLQGYLFARPAPPFPEVAW